MALPSPADLSPVDPSPADLSRVDPTLVTATTLVDRGRGLPVDEVLAPTLTALPRGHIITCDGGAALSLAAALMARSTRSGSWVAAVGSADLGAECLAGFDVDLTRLIRVEVTSGAEWSECIAAATDGFDIVLTDSSAVGVAPNVDRSVRQRIRGRGAVLLDIVVPPTGSSRRTRRGLSSDVALEARPLEWCGPHRGAGHLAGRRVMVTAHGRRRVRPSSATYWMPAPDGSITVER